MYSFTDERVVHPLMVSGDWVKVTLGGHTGWLEWVMLCSNPLTTCP